MTGRLSTLGFKRETTEGTAITVDKFFQARSFPFERTIEELVSQGLTGNLGPPAIIQGKRIAGAKIVTDLFDAGLASYLTPHFGSVVTTGAGPYTHTYTFGPVNYGVTLQAGVAQLDSDLVPWTLTGSKVSQWSLAAAVGTDLVALDSTWLARNLAHTTPTLAAASYATAVPYSWTQATTLTVGGTAAPNATEISLQVNRQMEAKWGLGSATARRIVHSAALVEVSGTIAVPYENQDWFDDHGNNTTKSIVLGFTDGTDSFTVTCQAKLTGDLTPKVNDAGEVMQSVGFRGFGTNAQILSAVLVSSEASAA